MPFYYFNKQKRARKRLLSVRAGFNLLYLPSVNHRPVDLIGMQVVFCFFG